MRGWWCRLRSRRVASAASGRDENGATTYMTEARRHPKVPASDVDPGSWLSRRRRSSESWSGRSAHSLEATMARRDLRRTRLHPTPRRGRRTVEPLTVAAARSTCWPVPAGVEAMRRARRRRLSETLKTPVSTTTSARRSRGEGVVLVGGESVDQRRLDRRQRSAPTRMARHRGEGGRAAARCHCCLVSIGVVVGLDVEEPTPASAPPRCSCVAGAWGDGSCVIGRGRYLGRPVGGVLGGGRGGLGSCRPCPGSRGLSPRRSGLPG